MEGMGLIMLHNYNICTQILKNISFLTVCKRLKINKHKKLSRVHIA